MKAISLGFLFLIIILLGCDKNNIKTVNKCCIVDSTFLKKDGPGKYLAAPTAFTPNADGINDLFSIIVLTSLNSFNLVVYDDLGKVLYETDDINASWNGEINNVIVSGKYKYKISAVTSAGDPIKVASHVCVLKKPCGNSLLSSCVFPDQWDGFGFNLPTAEGGSNECK